MNIKEIIISTCLSSLSAITYAAPTFFSGIDWSYDPSGNVVINSGYYDVNKKFDTSINTWIPSDGPLCWAASSSNILQHWQDKVRAQYGGLPSGIPDGVGVNYELAIYESIKAAISPAGGGLPAAASWFLFDKDILGFTATGGYWLPYISGEAPEWYDSNFSYKLDLSGKDCWSQLFTDDDQLPVSLYIVGPTSHAMTLYGYEYLSDTSVTLWLADSDDLFSGVRSYELILGDDFNTWKFGSDANRFFTVDGKIYNSDLSDYIVDSANFLTFPTDNLLLTIPEPSTYALLLGIVALLFIAVRRRK